MSPALDKILVDRGKASLAYRWHSLQMGQNVLGGTFWVTW